MPSLCVFHPIWVFAGGSRWGRGTTCLCNFPASAAQKWTFPKLVFFNTLTIHNDQLSYVKHVLDPIHVLFTPFGCLDVGKELGHNLLMHSQQLKNGNHLEERLLDQAQARTSYTPPFGGYTTYIPFGGLSIPKGMILDVQPLVKSSFCPIKRSPNGFLDSEASIP